MVLGLLEKKKKLRRKKFSFSFGSLGGSKKVKTILISFFVIFVALGLFGYFYVYQSYKNIRAEGEKVVVEVQKAKEAFKSNDIDKVDAQMQNVDNAFNSFQAEAKKVYWMGNIPLLGLYVKDFHNGVEAGDHLIDAGIKTVKAIKPHADLVGFSKESDTSFIEKPAELRLQTAVLTLDQILADVDSIAEDVDLARNNIDKIDPNRYPKEIKGIMLRDQVANGKAQFEGIASLFVDAKPFIKALPDILGAKEDKTYLILFMNDKELRATGGFITAYAVFDVKQGKFEVRDSSDIYSLDDAIPNHPAAPREIATYHKNVSKLYLRDSNLSPDYPTSVEMFDKLYRQSKNSVDYDGMIAVDTHVLVDALRVLGDTQVRGINFSAEEDPRCDCPQVIYKLLDEIDRPVAYLKADRKGILGDLLLSLMNKALGFSPSRYWGRLSQDVMTNLNEKHILIYMKDPEVQKSVEALHYGGVIEEYDGDYLHITDVNFAGAKSNLYVKHSVESDTQIADDGTVTRTLKLEYTNPYPHSNCSLEQSEKLGAGGLCINATLRNWLRVYVPEGSKLVSFDGSEKDVQTYDELGKTVYEGFMTVKPDGGKANVTVTYTLPFKVDKAIDYKLLIQKQPGTAGHAYTVNVNGRQAGQFDLIKDKEIKLK